MSAPPSPTRVGVVFGALLVPTFVALGAPSVALPSIGRDLAIPFGATAWVLASWALASAVAMPLFGRLSRRTGLRRSIAAGVLLVCVGSVVAALAPDLALVVVGRTVGGAGAGALVISTYASVAARLEAGERPRALAVVAAASATASGAGTLVGGLLTTWPGWRAVVALPALVLLAAVPAVRLAPGERVAGERVDAVGALLLSALGAAVVVLLQGPSVGLPATVAVGLAALAVAAAIGLVVHGRGRPGAFVPGRVVRASGFAAAGAVGLVVFAAYYAALFAVPALLERSQGWGAVAVGAALLPCAAFSVLGARTAAALVRREAPVGVLALALCVTSAAGVVLGALVGGSAVVSVAGLALATAAFAGAQAVLFGLVPALVEARDSERAQGLFDFVVYGGSSIGPAVVGGLSAVLGLQGALGLAAVLPVAGIAAALALRRSVREHGSAPVG